MFNSTADLKAKKPSYKAWCFDTNRANRSGHVFQYVDPKDAAVAATEDMLAKFPDEPKLCNVSDASVRSLLSGSAASALLLQ